MASVKAKGGRRNRKWSRNKDFCKFYRLSRRRERNKLVKLEKHLKRFPADKCAQQATDRCKAVI